MLGFAYHTGIPSRFPNSRVAHARVFLTDRLKFFS